MEENKGWTEESAEVESPETPEAGMEELAEEPREPGMGIFQKIIGIYIDPVNTLKAIGGRPEFWTPWIIFVILSVGAMVYNLDTFMAPTLATIQAQGNMPEGQSLEQMEGMMRVGLPVSGLVQGVFLYGILWVVSAFLLWLVGMFLGGSAGFGRMFSLSAWTMMPAVFQQLFANIMIHGKEFSTTEHLQEVVQASTIGLGSLFKGDGFVYNLFAQIDIFWIWGLVLMIIGLPLFSDLKGSQSTTTVIIVKVLMLLVGGVMMGMQ